jgi:hypothetical protein
MSKPWGVSPNLSQLGRSEMATNWHRIPIRFSTSHKSRPPPSLVDRSTVELRTDLASLLGVKMEVCPVIGQVRNRLREITDHPVEPRPDSLTEKLDELRTSAALRLARLRDLLADPKAVQEARALRAEQVGKFTLVRVSEYGKMSFKANGKIDFFGQEAFTRVGGAGGQDSTVCSFEFCLLIAA